MKANKTSWGWSLAGRTRSGARGRGVPGLLLLVLAVGCAQAPEQTASDGQVDELARSTEQAATEADAMGTAAASAAAAAAPATLPTVTVTLPPGGSVETTPIAANGTLILKDRASVKSQANAHLPLQNLGAATTDIGVGTTTASLTSKASVFLRNNARVQGHLKTAGTLTKQAGAVVTLTTTQRATLPPPVTKTWTVPLASTPSAPHTVPDYGSLTLAPGSYGKLSVLSFATVTLTSGVYAFSDLQLESDSTVHLNLTGTTGPVVVYLDTFSAFRGKVTTTGPDAATKLLLVHRGTTTIRIEKSAPMALIAPSATVELGTGGLTHRGTIFAKGISLDPDVKMVYVPFAHWDWLEPITPYVSCVLPTGRGTYAAAFGYENPAGSTITVSVGSNNSLNPNPGSAYLIPESLLPGRNDRVMWAPLAGPSLTWQLMGRSAVATLASQRCEFGSGDPPIGEQPQAEGRTHPRASAPPVPAPRRFKLILENASGPGSFPGAVSSLGTSQQALTSGVADPLLERVRVPFGLPPLTSSQASAKSSPKSFTLSTSAAQTLGPKRTERAFLPR